MRHTAIESSTSKMDLYGRRSSPKVYILRVEQLKNIKLKTKLPIPKTKTMLKNHLKIAFRQLKKQKFYSAVNILGLAAGVASCLLISLFVMDELSYDQQQPSFSNFQKSSYSMFLSDCSSLCPSPGFRWATGSTTSLIGLKWNGGCLLPQVY